MLKIFNKAFSLVFVFSFIMSGQNKKIEENSTFQKSMYFSENVSKESAIKAFLLKFDLNNDNTFVSSKSETNSLGLNHQRHQQYYKGIKVEFGTLITHAHENNVESINAELYNAQSLDIMPSLSAQQCFLIVTNEINAQKYLWDNKEQAAILNYEKPSGELVIFPIVVTGEIRLAYKYDIYSLEPLARQEVYVDAHSGAILYKNPIIKHLNDFSSSKPIVNKDLSVENFDLLITGNANTKYSGLRSIETTFDSSTNFYILNDITRGAPIKTYNCKNVINTYQNINFSDNDNNWTTSEHSANFDNAALDAHWGSEMTYDFWKINFNRNSYDDNNSDIISYVHYKPTAASYSNAFWNGSFMTYGDGVTKPFTSIDICGHEIGHGICQYTAGLAYQNQSGAMNEAFSDIWGSCIEHYGRTGSMSGTPAANVWKIGEDISASGLRSMSNPLTFGDPDTFRGTNWVVTGDDGACTPTSANDRCGVHTNSGVVNHWFYILSMGASGINNAPLAERDTYNVTGIGIQKASQIAYLAERDYLTPNSTFYDLREATITVAKSLYCTSGTEVVAVTDSWFAVNVGPSFLYIAKDISIKKIPIISPISCNASNIFTQTIYFDNLGTNPITSVNISYNIDGGANSTPTWNGNISTCSTGSYDIAIDRSLLSKGTHILNVTLSINGDIVSTNNTTTGVIFVNTPASVNQVNTFESNNDVLVSYDENGSNNVWERGTSSKSTLTDLVAANSKVYSTKLSQIYPPNTKSYLVSQCYDLSQTSAPILKFDMAFDTEANADILYMQYSTNGGNSWSLLGSQDNPNWYTSNSGCPNCIGGEWTGEADITNSSGLTNGTRRSYSYDLASLSSNSNIIFRYVFQSDSMNELDGVIIDNFVVESTLSNSFNEVNNFVVFPNPVNEVINISFNSKSNEKVNFELNDMQGRLIFKKSDMESVIGNFEYALDVTNIPSGFYLLKISQGNYNYSTKIIKNIFNSK
ncbi:M4 family metallopeptidase [Flavobacterium sp.]|jgi:Zn-dependent metalloprotease|uniref:M4 family metallopeptidase n=1 Tax=Flavobacterium sp. TaxID=239 RepID=UPI0037BEF3A9